MISEANIYDIKLLEETLEHIVVPHLEPDEEHPQNLCLDADYTGSGEAVEQCDYFRTFVPEARRRRNWSRHLAFTHAAGLLMLLLFNRFRKLLARHKKKAVNYMALLQFACAVIV